MPHFIWRDRPSVKKFYCAQMYTEDRLLLCLARQAGRIVERNRRSPVLDRQLFIEVGQVKFHRVGGNAQLFGQFTIGQSLGQCFQHDPFFAGQGLDRVLLQVADIHKGKHHLARCHVDAGGQQPVHGTRPWGEGGGACGHGQAGQVAVVVAVHHQFWGVGLFAQNLDQLRAAQGWQVPINDAHLDGQTHHRAQEPFRCAHRGHHRESAVAFKNFGHGGQNQRIAVRQHDGNGLVKSRNHMNTNTFSQ